MLHRRGVSPLTLISSALFELGGAILFSSIGVAEGLVLPVPTVTIYPGDKILDNWIGEREFPAHSTYARGDVVTDRAVLVGKTSRRTLLPGKPIPPEVLSEPKVVVHGAKVRIIFAENGLMITAFGSALQSGSIGDSVSVRNLDSGLIVSGVIQTDGTIRVSGS